MQKASYIYKGQKEHFRHSVGVTDTHIQTLLLGIDISGPHPFASPKQEVLNWSPKDEQ